MRWCLFFQKNWDFFLGFEGFQINKLSTTKYVFMFVYIWHQLEHAMLLMLPLSWLIFDSNNLYCINDVNTIPGVRSLRNLTNIDSNKLLFTKNMLKTCLTNSSTNHKLIFLSSVVYPTIRTAHIETHLVYNLHLRKEYFMKRLWG